MRKLLLLVPVLLFVSKLHAQSPRWGISITPSIVYATSGSYGLQLGAEYNFTSRMGVLTELTVPLRNHPDPSVTDQHFLRIKPEFRYFLTNREENANVYTGLQISYSFRNWKDKDGSYFEERLYEDSAITFQDAYVRSPVFTSSAQFGSVFTIGDHFAIDMFLGIGVRMINTTYSDLQNTGKTYSVRPNCKIMFSPDPAWWVNGAVVRPHFNTGFRILYRF